VVANEWGGVSGIATLENALEEIIGESACCITLALFERCEHVSLRLLFVTFVCNSSL
jgi:hypothetical protein